MLALALGRPLAIEDADCDVEIPVELDDELLPQYFAGALLPQGQISLMRGFIELISLYRIAGRVLREVYALDKCKDNLEIELTRLADETEAPTSFAKLQRQYESRISQLEQQLERGLLPWRVDVSVQEGQSEYTVKAGSPKRIYSRLMYIDLYNTAT